MYSFIPMLLLLGIRRVACRSSPAFFVSNRPSWRHYPASAGRFMSTDAAAAGERTEEEKAAIKAAREAKK